jgi:hypothetical protein
MVLITGFDCKSATIFSRRPRNERLMVIIRTYVGQESTLFVALNLKSILSWPSGYLNLQVCQFLFSNRKREFHWRRTPAGIDKKITQIPQWIY